MFGKVGTAEGAGINLC